MKKEELNETFDNIVASNAQKERIFNNIMNKKNKGLNFKTFMAIFGTLAVGGVCICFFI